MPRSPGRTGHEWRKRRQIVLDTYDTCWICGQLVDKTLSGRHPDGPTVDHLDPIAYADIHGGDPLDLERLRLAHLRCNVARGNRMRIKTAGSAFASRSRRSREW